MMICPACGTQGQLVHTLAGPRVVHGNGSMCRVPKPAPVPSPDA